MTRWLVTVGFCLSLCFLQQEKPALKLPEGWNPKDPLPIEKSNCVRCHLTAGRELTAPVRDFARSVHDHEGMSCNTCHGGNTKDDSKAHEHDFGFIGTKLSAHMAVCSDCHARQAEEVEKGPHFWDLSKGINKDYPVCIDCHGNHDVGRPPVEFSLTNVCTDCHKGFSDKMPAVAAVVAENDKLWEPLRKTHARSKDGADIVPQRFQKERDRLRAATGRWIHAATKLSSKQADSLNHRVGQFREQLETWLKDPR